MKHAHREATIKRPAEFYDRNPTESLLHPSDDVPRLVGAIRQALVCEDLTHTQRRELAESPSILHFHSEFSTEEERINACVDME